MHPENQVGVFLSHSGARPLCARPVGGASGAGGGTGGAGDWLLVFSALALYVDRAGLRARDTELMYTAHPTYHGHWVFISFSFFFHVYSEVEEFSLKVEELRGIGTNKFKTLLYSNI